MTWLHTKESLQWRTAPDFNLESIQGFDLSLSSFWYRSNMVLVFCRPQSDPQLKAFCDQLAGINRAIQAEVGKLVLLLYEDQSGQKNGAYLQGLPFAVLRDRLGHVHERYQAFLPAIAESGFVIFVLDRYGAIFAAYNGHQLSDPLPGSEIVDWLQYIELQCPE
jgi:peroxiredoxin